MKTAYLSLIVILLFITACTGGGTPKKDDPYHKGTDGLVMTFPPNVPPAKVYEDDTFNILLRIENKGAYSLIKTYDTSNNIQTDEYGVILLTPPSTFYIITTYTDPNQKRIYLNGKSPGYPNGDTDIHDYGFYVRPMPGERERAETPLAFTLCYPYQTELIQDVCIDSDITTTDVRKKVCQMKDISLSGQGAPVAITKIEPRAKKEGTGITVEFILTIENVGKGKVMTKNQVDFIEDQCTSVRQERDDWNTLTIDAELMGRKLNCVKTELLDNKATVKCGSGNIDNNVWSIYNREETPESTTTSSMSIGEARNFMSVLYVTLDYLYQEHLSTTIKIERFNT